MESCNIFIPLLSAWTEYSDTYCSLIYKIENNEDHCMSVVNIYYCQRQKIIIKDLCTLFIYAIYIETNLHR